LLDIGRRDLLAEPASIEFRFVRLKGQKLDTFLNESGLRALRERFWSMSENDRDGLRLSNSEYLNSVDEPQELTVLTCSELGGLGMYGHWYTNGLEKLSGSRLKYALVTSRGEKGDLGTIGAAGGSWGHGKKAIATGSKCRVLIVSTAFLNRTNPDQDDVDVSRRILGVAYWKNHSLQGRTFAGLGLLGQVREPDAPKWMEFTPLENEAADMVASSLGCPGFEARNPQVCGMSGSSYLVVEPSFDASELAWAIRRNWWPLLMMQSETVRISVRDIDGTEVAIEPASDSSLAPFIRCLELARGESAPNGTGESLCQVKKVTHLGKEKIHGSVEIGTLACTSDISPNGWSWKAEGNNSNVYCLVRGEMVIGYFRHPVNQGSRPPFVRATFFVDPTEGKNDVAARILRLTEPHLHDEWRTMPDNAVALVDADFAKKVMAHIKTQVREFQKSLRESPQAIIRNFPEFSRYFRVGKRNKPRKKGKGKSTGVRSRFFSIQQLNLKRQPDHVDNKLLVAQAEFKIDLLFGSSTFPIPSEMDVVINLGWRTLEDGQTKLAPELTDTTLLKIPPSLKLNADGSLTGRLKRGQPIIVSWKSRPYSGDWTVAPDPNVKPAFDDEVDDGGPE